MSSSALADGLHRLRGKLAVQQHHDDSDEQLLRSFLNHRDDSAFTVLVRRHGPMVLRVCRRVLGQQQDAEDAFQATFLVLARNAAALRNKTSLAGFLHGTAYRTALKAKQTAGRRRKYESRAPYRSSIDPADEMSWREVRTLLDEEIARLPEKYQSVFILCCLEEMNRAEAARRLGLKDCTLANRLTEARKLLRQRLARRGVELTAVLAAVAFEAQTASALPRIIGADVSPAVVALANSASPILNIGKVKLLAVLLLSVAASGSMIGSHRTAGEPPAAAANQKDKAIPLPQTTAKTATIRGRVLAPDGKPATGARVCIHPEFGIVAKELTETTTDKDGRFALSPAPADLLNPKTKFPLHHLRIVAMAKGCGPDWQDVPHADAGKEITLRLVKDDVPIRGRILSLEGKPLAGIKVSVKSIEAFRNSDLTPVLRAMRNGSRSEDADQPGSTFNLSTKDSSWSVQTDAEGRFRLDGIGRERIVRIHVQGPGIHYSSLRAMTRNGEAVQDVRDEKTIRPAVFEHLARPSRLIRGTVREKGTGKPLAGIRVGSLQTTAHATTDAAGRYELPGSPKGEKYRVMVYPIHGEPYILSSVAVKDTVGLGAVVADVELTRGIVFEGQVIDDETGKPVAGDITYNPLNPNPYVRGAIGGGAAAGAGPFSEADVKADGSFRCVVLPGRGAVSFRSKDNERYMAACVDSRTIQVEGGKDYLPVLFGNDAIGFCPQEQYQAIVLINPAEDTKTIRKIIRVKPAPILQGAIQDADGKPLMGAKVRGLQWLGDWTTLAADRFSVHGVNPQRPRRLYFLHAERRLIGTLEVKGTETEPLTVRLQPWAGIRGRLLNAEGQPIRNARILGHEYLVADDRTDGEGRFRVEGLIPGRRYDLTYNQRKPQLAGGRLIEGFIGKPGEIRDLGDVRGRPFREE